MAQSVAHLIGSEEVTGSIPVNSFREGIEPCKINETPRVASLLVKLKVFRLFYRALARDEQRSCEFTAQSI